MTNSKQSKRLQFVERTRNMAQKAIFIIIRAVLGTAAAVLDDITLKFVEQTFHPHQSREAGAHRRLHRRWTR